ncbi:MAG: lipid-A-disaccharide synthase [Woeseiaceae bacterium]|nr:lipid-A-disaccharide synthase [Woeseiaceae bacterium]
MKFGLVAGEASGDLLGAGLIRALRERIPDARFEGVAGPSMIAAGCDCWEEAEALAVMGLIEPLKHLPRLLKLRKMLVERWRADPPDVFIGIDAPDFNLGLEARLRESGIRTAHYVSPTVWAWRQGRIKTIARAADLVLCILPFEKTFYDEHGIRAEFVGHPMADSAPADVDVAAARRALDLGADDLVVAVLPGSRGSEVSRLAPLFAEAAAMLAARFDTLHFVTPVATPKLKPLIETAVDEAGVAGHFRLLDGDSYEAMAAADLVLLASGTAALEAALLRKPIVAAYKVAPLTATIVRAFGMLKVNQFTMPNHLTEEPVVPEFIQEEATPERLAAAVAELLDSPERRAEISDIFATLRAKLALDADQRAADAVLSLTDHAARKPVPA